MIHQFVGVIFRRPTSPLDKIMNNIFNLLFISDFFYLPIILGLFKIQHSHELSIIMTATVIF
jgi:hypothetical protein